MVQRTISAEEARQHLPEYLSDVARQDDQFVVESDGKPVAALVSIKHLAVIERRRDALIERMEQAAAHAGLTPEEADRIANEAVEAVRAERRARG
ncbi:MAG: type II toxin-antitoxin system prevent-host-death family antitoxin [Thermomicrobiales bacterium]